MLRTIHTLAASANVAHIDRESGITDQARLVYFS
jgi:hypothetical protein